MNTTYDQHYQTKNLFGAPYPELMAFFAAFPKNGKVLDLGCGQGRDAIALARLGYSVTGIDNSAVGVKQMNQIGQAEKLNLVGEVADIYVFDNFEAFDFVLLDSMFHFNKNDKEKEVGLLQKILSKLKNGGIVVVCIQDTGKKVQILNQAINGVNPLRRLIDRKFIYTFEDKESGHQSVTDYRLIAVEKDKA